MTKQEERRSWKGTLSRFGKFCRSSAEVLTNAQRSCVELYGGCSEELVVFLTFGTSLSSQFITFASYHTLVILLQYKINIP